VILQGKKKEKKGSFSTQYEAMSVSRGASDSYVTLAPRQQAIGMWARIQQVSDSKWWAHLRSFATSFQSLVNFHK
jgi:hypothetical protein